MSCPDCKVTGIYGVKPKPKIIPCPLHAHAKELLEALKKAHDCLEREFGDYHTWHKNKEDCELCDLIKKCEESK